VQRGNSLNLGGNTDKYIRPKLHRSLGLLSFLHGGAVEEVTAQQATETQKQEAIS